MGQDTMATGARIRVKDQPWTLAQGSKASWAHLLQVRVTVHSGCRCAWQCTLAAGAREALWLKPSMW